MEPDRLSPRRTSLRESEMRENPNVEFDSVETVRVALGNSLEIAVPNEVFPNIGQYRIQPIQSCRLETFEHHPLDNLTSGKLSDDGAKSPCLDESNLLSCAKSSLASEAIIGGNSTASLDSAEFQGVISLRTSEENSPADIVPDTEPQLPPETFGDGTEKFNSHSDSQHETGTPTPFDRDGTIVSNLPGGNPSNDDALIGVTTKQCPHSVISACAQNAGFDSTEPSTAVIFGSSIENSAASEVPKVDDFHPERRCSNVPGKQLYEKLSGSAGNAEPEHDIENSNLSEMEEMIELNILGGSTSNDVNMLACAAVQECSLSISTTAISEDQSEFPRKNVQESPLSGISTSAQNQYIGETGQKCPHSVMSTSAQNPAVAKNQLGVLIDGKMKPCYSETVHSNSSADKLCEKAIRRKDETPLCSIDVSKLSSDTGRLVSEYEKLPDGHPTDSSSQDYGRVGDDVGGGQDREDMSMSHPGNSQQGAQVIPDEAGNLRILVRKTKPLLGIAIEGGANTRHPLPRIININENGAAYDAGGLQVGQLILEVDGHKVEGMHHQEVARLIAESFAQRDKPHIEFLVVEAKKSNLEPKPTALIFLEA